MASQRATFDWGPDCSVERGSESGCVGLAEWKEGVVWRGSNCATEMFKVSEGRWERWADNEGVGKATLVVCRDNLLAVGGQQPGGQERERYSTKVRMLNKGKKKWLYASEIPDMLIGCGQSRVISDGNLLVVMGGCGDSGVLDTIQVYNHVTRAWSMGRSLPTPCACGSAILHQDSIILLGGNHTGTSVWHAKISELLEESHGNGSIWKRLPDLPYCWSSACMVSGVLLAIGGQDQSPASKKTTAIYALSQMLEMWLHVGDLPFECSLVDSLVCSGDLMVVDGGSGRAVLGKVNGLRERLKSLEKENIDVLRKEVMIVREQLRKSDSELEAAVREKEEERLAPKTRESELISQHTQMLAEMEDKQKALSSQQMEVTAINEQLRKSRSELESALRKKEEEMQALKNTLESALMERVNEIATLHASFAADRHHMEVIEKERLKLKDMLEQAKRIKKESPKALSEPQKGNANASDIFRNFYALMIDTINPDDLTHKLYSSELLSSADMCTIDHSQNTHMMKSKLLLNAVERAITIDDKNFKVFLTNLEAVSKYKHLCEIMTADAQILDKKNCV